MSLHEFDVIKQYFTRASKQSSVIKSVGDDCAIVSVDTDKQLVMSMDTMVAERHFPISATPRQIATRALTTSLSDLVAMGAKPLWFTLGLTMPSVDRAWLAEFSEGLFSIADKYGVDLIGGDTTQGPLTISIQVHGEVDADKAFTRDAACVGDSLFVTGTLGDGAAALAVLLDEVAVSQNTRSFLNDRFYQPELPFLAAQQLVNVVNAAIDISDGLIADATHIAEASGVSIELNADFFPIAPEVKAMNSPSWLGWALSGGDDYQLLFTVAKDSLPDFYDIARSLDVQITCIGKVVPKDGGLGHVSCYANDQRIEIPSNKKGYQHFVT